MKEEIDVPVLSIKEEKVYYPQTLVRVGDAPAFDPGLWS